MSVHTKYKCKHGTIVRQCRCPGGNWVVVVCPSWCPYKDEEYVPKHMK